jgi:hypothetical protein
LVSLSIRGFHLWDMLANVSFTEWIPTNVYHNSKRSKQLYVGKQTLNELFLLVLTLHKQNDWFFCKCKKKNWLRSAHYIRWKIFPEFPVGPYGTKHKNVCHPRTKKLYDFWLSSSSTEYSTNIWIILFLLETL